MKIILLQLVLSAVSSISCGPLLNRADDVYNTNAIRILEKYPLIDGLDLFLIIFNQNKV